MSEVINKFFIVIDFGTTNISIGAYLDQKCIIIKNTNNEMTISPSIIFEDNNFFIINKNELNKKLENYESIIYDIKRLIGLKYDELSQKEFFKNLSFEIFDIDNIPKIKIIKNGKDLLKTIEEICSSIFKEIIKLTENYLAKLGKAIKITKAYIILPKFFSNRQKKSIEFAAILAGIDDPKIVDESFPEMIGYALNQDLFYKKEDNMG